MKEATGELNMTVVTVVAIAAVAAFFYAFIWPSIKTNILNSTKCSSAYNCTCGENGSAKTCKCYYLEGDKETEVTCPNNSDKGTGTGTGTGTGGAASETKPS